MTIPNGKLLGSISDFGLYIFDPLVILSTSGETFITFHKETHENRNRIFPLSLFTFMILALFSIAGCSSATAPTETDTGSTQQAVNGPLSCTTDAQCQSVAWYQAGFCADLTSGVCTSDHTCSYWLDTSNSACHCIVGQERKCAAGGYQTCFQTYSGGDYPAANTSCTYTSALNFTDSGEYKSCTPWRWQDCIGSSAGHVPACSSIDSINSGNGCWPDINGNGQCITDITTDSSEAGCTCVEDSVRDCIVYPGATQGHQVCTVDTTHTASNSWGHPTVWSSCN